MFVMPDCTANVARFDVATNLSNLSAVTRLTPVSIPVNKDIAVSGLTTVPKATQACLIFAHGAGAGITHPFMVGVCDGLRDSRRPDGRMTSQSQAAVLMNSILDAVAGWMRDLGESAQRNMVIDQAEIHLWQSDQRPTLRTAVRNSCRS
jgi:hypothetical protein